MQVPVVGRIKQARGFHVPRASSIRVQAGRALRRACRGRRRYRVRGNTARSESTSASSRRMPVGRRGPCDIVKRCRVDPELLGVLHARFEQAIKSRLRRCLSSPRHAVRGGCALRSRYSRRSSDSILLDRLRLATTGSLRFGRVLEVGLLCSCKWQ